MARMKRGARTQAVRDYLAEHPDASPKEIVAGLAERGVKVKITLANSIKYKSATPRKRRRAPSARMAARKTQGFAGTFEQLVEVKRLVEAMGGIDNLRRSLDMLEQLQ